LHNIQYTTIESWLAPVKALSQQTEELVRVHCRFGMFLALTWVVAVQSAQAFAMDPTLSGTSATSGAPGSLTVTGGKQFALVGSVTDANFPEPGIVALLGFGLVLLGLSYARAAGKSGRSRGPMGTGGSNLTQKVGQRSPP